MLYAFDLLFLDGENFRAKPLEDRRAALGGIVPAGGAVVMSEEFAGAGGDLFKLARRHRVEAARQAYRSGRRDEWRKTKCVQSDEFVIIGYQPTSSAVRGALTNIKIATFDGTRLRYAGAVGTGFSDAVAPALRKLLDGIVTAKCPVAGLKGKGAVWVSPDLKAKIAYCGLTRQVNYGMPASTD